MNKAERLFPLSLSPSLLSFPPCHLINNYRPQTRGIQDRVGINEPRHHGKVWPGSLRGDLRRDFRKRQPSWALSWALCGLTWMSLTLIFFVRPTPPAYSSHLFMSLPQHLCHLNHCVQDLTCVFGTEIFQFHTTEEGHYSNTWSFQATLLQSSPIWEKN